MAGFSDLPVFEDFDDEIVYKKGEQYIFQADALNFVIEFDSDKAIAALELSATSIQELINAKPSPAITRWINLWCPEQQQATVQALAAHYGFSPRLTGIMCSEPNTPTPAGIILPAYSKPHYKSGRISQESHSTDPEKNGSTTSESTDPPLMDLSHYRIVDEVWYYCSVDWGSKYLCVGYNSLSQLHAPEVNDDPNDGHMSNKPQGRRLWTWLIHCHDGTIISIHENPFPKHQGVLDDFQQRTIGNMRRNLFNVFKQLSKVNDAWRKANPITSLPLRSGFQNIDGSEIDTSDSPSLLFYYLFDDWFSSYNLVAKQEHQYGKQLGHLRDKMFAKPEVEHIQRLHHIGQQLAVLKKIYQSYALIIDRILDRQKPVDMSNSTQLLQENISEDKAMLTARSVKYAVPLSSAATVRFERLRDRINYYALSEIQECLEEKESLVFLNFNLITLKQSAAVERLTRITILLAKVTILFMPVSLMTAYFSVEIEDLQGLYTAATYWVSFAVIMALSFVFLLVFGYISGTVEGKPIYRSFTQIFVDKSRDSWKRRRFSYKP